MNAHEADDKIVLEASHIKKRSTLNEIGKQIRQEQRKRDEHHIGIGVQNIK